MIRCRVCHLLLRVMHRPGYGVLVWDHPEGPAERLASTLYDHEPEPQGEGWVRLEAASRSLKVGLDAVQAGGQVADIAETLRLASYQIAAFQDWAQNVRPEAMLAGVPAVDPEFDARRAFIPDSPEGLT